MHVWSSTFDQFFIGDAFCAYICLTVSMLWRMTYLSETTNLTTNNWLIGLFGFYSKLEVTSIISPNMQWNASFGSVQVEIPRWILIVRRRKIQSIDSVYCPRYLPFDLRLFFLPIISKPMSRFPLFSISGRLRNIQDEKDAVVNFSKVPNH